MYKSNRTGYSLSSFRLDKRKFSTEISEEEEIESSLDSTDPSSDPSSVHYTKRGRTYAKRRALLHPRYQLTSSGRFLQPVDRSELPRTFVVAMEEKLAPLRARVKEQGDLVRQLKSQGMKSTHENHRQKSLSHELRSE